MTRCPHRVHRDFHLPVLLLKFHGKRYLCWTLLAVAMIAGRVALLPWMPPPEPVAQDEFSYLLAADTFAHGRVTNPAPNHPEFFEAGHILASPVYISKYPPGQGIVLALGQKLTGHPYWGVVLSGALMVYLFCWAANAWLPPQWTLITGVLSVVFFFVRDYWFNSYWGGAVAASGGALVVGGMGYLFRGDLRPARFSLGLGAVVLYATRPYEGGALCLTAIVILAWYVLRLPHAKQRRALTRVVLPNVAVLAAAVPLALWYNASVTGSAFEMPYSFYARHADLITPFWVLPPLPTKHYSTGNVAASHQWELRSYWEMREQPLPLLLGTQLAHFGMYCLFRPFAGFCLLLLGVPWARVGQRKKFLILLFAGGLAAFLPEVWIQGHYAAPFQIVYLILIVAAARAVWYRLACHAWGRPVTGVLIALLLAPLFMHYLAAIQHHSTRRTRLSAGLVAAGGRHLVFVDYAPGWESANEWVYNGADLASAPVLFAHDLGNDQNRVLLGDYPGRTAWGVRLGPRAVDFQIERYSPDFPGAGLNSPLPKEPPARIPLPRSSTLPGRDVGEYTR